MHDAGEVKDRAFHFPCYGKLFEALLEAPCRLGRVVRLAEDIHQLASFIRGKFVLPILPARVHLSCV